jgi:hypothetical protein
MFRDEPVFARLAHSQLARLYTRRPTSARIRVVHTAVRHLPPELGRQCEVARSDKLAATIETPAFNYSFRTSARSSRDCFRSLLARRAFWPPRRQCLPDTHATSLTSGTDVAPADLVLNKNATPTERH